MLMDFRDEARPILPEKCVKTMGPRQIIPNH